MSDKINKHLLDLYLGKVLDTVVTMDTMDYGHHDHYGHHEFQPGQHPPGISQSNSDLLTESQLVYAVNLLSLDKVPFSYWNANIVQEKESDWGAEAVESQS